MKMRFTILSLLAACFLHMISYAAESKFAVIGGFKLEINEKTYTPDNLWDLINGAADSYLEYDFEELFLAEYTSNPNISIRVEVYMHKDKNGSFGIYSTERMPDYNFLPIGTEAYSASGILNLLTGKYYIKLQGNDGMALELIAEELVSHLSQDNRFPQELNMLPDARIPYSSGYANHNYLGHSFLHGFFFSSYKYEEDFQSFISVKETPEEARDVIKSFLDATGTKYKTIENGIYKIEDTYSGIIYIKLDGRYLYGTINCPKKKLAYYMIDTIRNKIN